MNSKEAFRLSIKAERRKARERKDIERIFLPGIWKQVRSACGRGVFRTVVELPEDITDVQYDVLCSILRDFNYSIPRCLRKAKKYELSWGRWDEDKQEMVSIQTMEEWLAETYPDKYAQEKDV